MNREQIIRAWKDEDYRAGLSEGELAALPAHPAGLIELSDAQIAMAEGREEEALITTIAVSVGVSIFVSLVVVVSHQLSCKVGGVGCADTDLQPG